MGILEAVLGVVKPIADSLFPDPKDQLKKQELQQQLQLAILEKSSEIEKAAASIINTEAASSHWLAANWRPLTMVVFVILIVARWFGLSAPNLQPIEYEKLWDIVEVGLGGYVIGRSVEKVVPSIASAFKK